MRSLIALCVLSLIGCNGAETPLTALPAQTKALPALPAEVKALHPLAAADKVLFVGDCVTAQGAEPTGYVTLIRERLTAKYPGIVIEAAGVNADNLHKLQQRYTYDVLESHPTLVVLLEGINDVRPQKVVQGGTASPQQRYIPIPAVWRPLLGSMIDGSPCHVVVCTPALLGEKKDGANEFDAKLDAFAEVCRQVAAEKKATLCDLRTIFKEHLRVGNPDNLAQGVLTKDGWHLNDAGNRLAAEAILFIIDPPLP